MDNTFYKMKESKLVELKNKVERLGKVVQALLKEREERRTKETEKKLDLNDD